MIDRYLPDVLTSRSTIFASINSASSSSSSSDITGSGLLIPFGGLKMNETCT